MLVLLPSLEERIMNDNIEASRGAKRKKRHFEVLDENSLIGGGIHER